MFFAAGFFGGDAVLLIAPAVVSGVAGLTLWGRANRQTAQPAVIAAVPDPRLDQVQETLASLQSDITHLREDREFMRNLYAGNKATHP